VVCDPKVPICYISRGVRHGQMTASMVLRYRGVLHALIATTNFASPGRMSRRGHRKDSDESFEKKIK